mmetsp:Transcript_6557/g.10334  ORF Transcript_6557/g.10334 Transcript_6557/m.10334 type:complete len:141 (-) Transcript_6557:25-447(-)
MAERKRVVADKYKRKSPSNSVRKRKRRCTVETREKMDGNSVLEACHGEVIFETVPDLEIDTANTACDLQKLLQFAKVSEEEWMKKLASSYACQNVKKASLSRRHWEIMVRTGAKITAHFASLVYPADPDDLTSRIAARLA